MTSSPPEGFRVRPATVEDAPAINELVIAVDTAVQGWSDSTPAEMVDWWRLTDLAANSWVVEDDSLAAYAVVIPHGESAETDGFVHPAKTGLGLGSWLLRRGRGARARTRLCHRAHVVSCAGRGCPRTLRALRVSRSAPLLPDARRTRRRAARAGVAGRLSREHVRARRRAGVSCCPGRGVRGGMELRLRAVRALGRETHQRSRLRSNPLVHRPSRRRDRRGAALRRRAGRRRLDRCARRAAPWRQRGLGLALLRHAFGEFYRRGQPRVGLGVDAQNPTGATRLYERAGMHIAYEAVAFEKELT